MKHVDVWLSPRHSRILHLCFTSGPNAFGLWSLLLIFYSVFGSKNTCKKPTSFVANYNLTIICQWPSYGWRWQTKRSPEMNEVTTGIWMRQKWNEPKFNSIEATINENYWTQPPKSSLSFVSFWPKDRHGSWSSTHVPSQRLWLIFGLFIAFEESSFSMHIFRFDVRRKCNLYQHSTARHFNFSRWNDFQLMFAAPTFEFRFGRSLSTKEKNAGANEHENRK